MDSKTQDQQRTTLSNLIWRVVRDVSGSVSIWDFKSYIFVMMFYRFLCEDFEQYMNGVVGDLDVSYSKISDDLISEEIKHDTIKVKGYFIYPSQLFGNFSESSKINDRLCNDLKNVFLSIEESSKGYKSHENVSGVFSDFDITSARLGNSEKDKNDKIRVLLDGIKSLNFSTFKSYGIDVFGDAYEALINSYASNAGKSGGEFFTPQNVSRLIAKIVLNGKQSINKVYDPTCGTGSLLLQVSKEFHEKLIEDGFYGQEINPTTYALVRMNMFLHNIGYNKFNIKLGNTLNDPHFGDDKPFDAIVSNPPFSVKWVGSDNHTLINDERFAPAGVLAPKSKADFAFVLHSLNYLSSNGRAAIVCCPGIFYRGGAEQKIRQYLVDNNYVEAVISLAPNLFFGTSISVAILVLAKNKKDTLTQFIDASDLFKKEANANVLLDEHINAIVSAFDRKETIAHFSRSVSHAEIAANDYNLSVSSYVQSKDTSEEIDIRALNAEVELIVKKLSTLRADIDAIVSDIIG